MSCAAGAPECVDADAALRFVRGQLAAEERAEIERRIDLCANCRRAIAEAARASSVEVATALERPPRATPAPSPRDSRDSGVLVPGETVGRYIVERPLGAGGMGVVSLARDPELRRAVVIKLVRPDAASGEGGDALEARLKREAQAMAQLSHPNVVQIFDIGRHGDRVFIAMEFVAGQTLDAWLIAREHSIGEILAMFRQAAAGLDAAHRAGLVHRDFKPSNVLVNGDGIAKVTDFGLARALAAGTSLTGMPAMRPTGVHAVLTQADAVVGTPAYMAPEQLAGDKVDARSDQYALALTLADALLGQSPTRRKSSPADGLVAIDRALAAANVPVRARTAIVRALQIDPAARFASIAELARELEPERKRRWLWPTLGGTVLAAGAIALAVRAGATCTSESPQVWAAQRAGVVSALSARAQPFAAWTAASIAGVLDAQTEQLGQLELGRCKREPEPANSCLDPRRRALDTALAQLATTDDPWSLVRAIERCDAPATSGDVRAALRNKPDADLARRLAERARTLGDDALAADAYELAGKQAMVAGDLATAEHDWREANAAGERLGDDGARGRARANLLELARWRCEHDAVTGAVTDLEGVAARHPGDAREEAAVAAQEALALTDVGDAAHGLPAWQRAIDAATKSSDASALLGARAGHARGRAVLQLDVDAARSELAAALAHAGAASPEAIANAQVIRAQLALDRGDAAEATSAVEELRSLHHADPFLAARVRALGGDVAGALADLDALPNKDNKDKPLAMHRALAAAAILRGANRGSEALAQIEKADLAMSAYDRVVVPGMHRYEIALARCEIAASLGENDKCYALSTFEKLDKNAAITARYALAAATVSHNAWARRMTLEQALGILKTIGAPPLRIAGVEWQLAQTDDNNLPARITHARAARDAFAAAKRTAEVTAIDGWLAANAPNAPNAPGASPAAAGSGDPWAR